VSRLVFSNRRRKTPFLPVFPRFSDFLSPADRPLRVGDESRLAPCRPPTHGVRRREPCVVRGWDFFCGGRKTDFRRLSGLPRIPPIRAPSPDVDFRPSPPRRSTTAKTASESDPVWRFYLSEAAEFLTFCSVTRIQATVTVAHRELCWRPAGRRSPPASAVARSRPDMQPLTTMSSEVLAFLLLVVSSSFFLHGCFRRCRYRRTVSDRCKTDPTASTTPTTTEYLETSDSVFFFAFSCTFRHFRHGVLRPYCHPALHRPCLY
jgi:hypothetical protein